MNGIIQSLTISTLVLALCTGDARAAGSAGDYRPMWRGPLGSGISPTGNPPVA